MARGKHHNDILLVDQYTQVVTHLKPLECLVDQDVTYLDVGMDLVLLVQR